MKVDTYSLIAYRKADVYIATVYGIETEMKAREIAAELHATGMFKFIDLRHTMRDGKGKPWKTAEERVHYAKE